MLEYEKQTIKLARQKEKELLRIMPMDTEFSNDWTWAEFGRKYKVCRYWLRKRICCCHNFIVPVTVDFTTSLYFLEDYDKLYTEITAFNENIKYKLKNFATKKA